MKMISCTYCGLRYVGISNGSDHNTFHIINESSGFNTYMHISVLNDVKELTQSEVEKSSSSLLGAIGAKPSNITINF